MLAFLNTYWKQVVVVLALVLAFGLGWGVRPAQVVEKEKVITVAGKETIKYIDRVTTITKNPDGTETTVITDKSKIDTKETTKTKTETSTETTSLSKYRVGAMVESKVSLTPAIEYRANAGMRVVGPFWLDGGYNISTKTAGLGISMEF